MIPAVPSIPPLPLAGLAPSTNVAPPASASVGLQSASAPSSSGFSDLLGQAIDSLDSVGQNADALAVAGATGQANVADVTVAATQAQLAIELTTAVRDKAVAAFNSIMAMPA